MSIGGPVTVLLRNVLIEGNAARSFVAQGGGIWIGSGSLRLVDSTIRDNVAQGQTAMPATPDGGTALGGGINSNSAASVLIRGSTISGNVTSGTNAGGSNGNGGSSLGGGIWAGGPLHIESSTVSGNAALDPGAPTGGGAFGIARGGGIAPGRTTAASGSRGTGGAASAKPALPSSPMRT